MAEAQWTQWSSFDELKVKFDNSAQPDNVTKENWHDSWFYAVGATWRPLDQLTLRTGVALDPDQWFGQVERVAAERIGRETVQYVSNILKYFVVYRRVAELQARKERALEAVRTRPS